MTGGWLGAIPSRYNHGMAEPRTFSELVQCVTDMLAEIVTNPEESAADRIRAGSIILDRALGKAVPMHVDDDRPLTQMTLQLFVPGADEPKEAVVHATPDE